MEAEEEPTECKDCHAIEGATRKENYRCVTCHEENAVHAHAKLDQEPSLQCLTCHDFLTERVEPWGCPACHVAARADATLREKFPKAGLVEVHGKEECEKCHAPHDTPSIKPGPCLECHEKLESPHHAKGLPDPEQCMECHQRHDKASVVLEPVDQCVACHEKPETADVVVTRAATFKGHDRCVTCHKSHQTTQVAKDCRTCHENMVVAGAEVKDHQSCTSCHSPHRKGAPAGGSCVECHDKKRNDHPAAEGAPKQATCVACHVVHPDAGVPAPGLPVKVLKPDRQAQLIRRCESCHDEAKSDTDYHDGTPCAACHVPHTFALEKRAGPEFCLSCHGTQGTGRKPPAQTIPYADKAPPKTLGPLVRITKDVTQVKVVKGHDTCADCHTKSSHQPNAALADCVSCHEHEPVAKSPVKGHEKCADCHKPHDGAVVKKCVECHEENRTGVHAKDAGKCEKCHRPHGPKGPEKPVPCLECHDKPLPGLHSVKEHTECEKCHAFHDQAPRSERAECLGACHKEHVNHEPTATTCAACHLFGKAQK